MRNATRGMAAAVVVTVGATALVLLAGAATAQGRGGLRECFGPGPLTAEEAEMTCVKHGDGEWRPVGGTDVTAGPAETAFGLFVVFGLLAMLVPGFIGLSLASSAKIPPAAGFLIGLFGSWVGLIALYLYGNWQSRSSPVISTGPAVERSTPDASSAADRLRGLKDLLDQGLITQDEYEARRRATVDNL
jgi:hypothetical protein